MKVFATVAACVLVLAAPAFAAEQSSAVITVVRVKAKGDGSAYLEKLRTAKPILMRLGASNYRVFRAAFAGEDANSIVAIAEYKDWPTFAQARVQRATDAEYQKWYKDLVASDVSELVSIDLLEEVSP